MESNEAVVITGSQRLEGKVIVNGAKNAALPILAASMLSEDRITLNNVPIVSDILTLKRAMERIGVSIQLHNNNAYINARTINDTVVPLEDLCKLRASILIAGPLLARKKEAIIAQPGGCAIGSRPIDLHLSGFEKLGAKVERLNKDYLRLTVDELKGSKIYLPLPSVGATENIMMASCLAEGRTVIANAAQEPEIVDLANFLLAMNARIVGAGTSTIVIDGVKRLSAANHSIIPDRIEAGSFMIASAITKGCVEVCRVNPAHINCLIGILKRAGITVETSKDNNSILVTGTKNCSSLNVVTEGYPGFPTDFQPLITTLLSLAKGNSVVTDTVFPERFCYMPALNTMGARIEVRGNSAFISGVDKLHGAKVSATDLRAGFALMLAGIAAEGQTTVNNLHYVKRGYQDIIARLEKLGAVITTIN